MKEDPTQNLGYIINDISRMLRRSFDRRAQNLGLTRSQWRVLLYLRRQDGQRQSDLAALLEIQPISLTRLIDRMVKNGWVERRDDPEDRRARRIFLTPKVQPLVGRLRELGKDVREEALTGIPKAERESLMKTLAHIRINVIAQQAGSSVRAKTKKTKR